MLAVGTRVAQLWPDFFETGVNSRYPWKLKNRPDAKPLTFFTCSIVPSGFRANVGAEVRSPVVDALSDRPGDWRVSIVGSPENDNWEMKVWGQTGLSGHTHWWEVRESTSPRRSGTCFLGCYREDVAGVRGGPAALIAFQLAGKPCKCVTPASQLNASIS